MDYRRFGDTVIARLDKGEEIHGQLRQIALKEDIRLAEISGLGAADDVTLGVFIIGEKRYHTNRFTGDMEIVSLTGTVSTMNGEYYAHLHMGVSDLEGRMFGGHLTEAVVSITCELVIRIIDGTVDRKHHPDPGVNLLEYY
ncbi:MAG: DNA-binding protein [Clostridia bacterium]|nr:DNA-binding protein [Clostridia bacterium]